MWVQLVVVEPETSDWNVCCSSGAHLIFNGPLIGDDRHETAGPTGNLEVDLKASEEHEERHFPYIGGMITGIGDSISRPYLAAVTLGVTGWSGSSADHDYWRCTVEDLTPQGRALYDSLAALYAGCDIHILTFLDT